MTTTGLPEPAGKCRARTSSPTTELTWCVNDCFSVRPFACRPTTPEESAAFPAGPVTSTARPGEPAAMSGGPVFVTVT
jgi:hypothetical protein